ncbi:MAG: T9SS type A sorting domain-containing protein, partial [Candidatus Cloacimonetes bacterium]|nr:T9SS type A sorting domain-containing protein [Candidatus Cloacimonadota bacterium]
AGLRSTSPEQAKIEIYNIKGQRVRTLECVNRVDAKATPSVYHVIWNGTDESGKPVGSGIYFCRLKVNEKSRIIKKMLLIK